MLIIYKIWYSPYTGETKRMWSYKKMFYLLSTMKRYHWKLLDNWIMSDYFQSSVLTVVCAIKVYGLEDFLFSSFWAQIKDLEQISLFDAGIELKVYLWSAKSNVKTEIKITFISLPITSWNICFCFIHFFPFEDMFPRS